MATSTNTYTLTDEERDAYKRLCKKLPDSIYDSDLNVYIILLAILCSWMEVKIEDLYKELDIDTASETSLRSYSKLLGYKWSEDITVNANRVRLKFFQYRRKYRGTPSSIRNLIRTSSNEEEFYSNTFNSEVTITENGALITVSLPDNMIILRGDISEVRPVGTKIDFILHTVSDIIDAIQYVPDHRYQYTVDQQLTGYRDERIIDWGLMTILNSMLSQAVVKFTTDNVSGKEVLVKITKNQG